MYFLYHIDVFTVSYIVIPLFSWSYLTSGVLIYIESPIIITRVFPKKKGERKDPPEKENVTLSIFCAQRQNPIING